MTGLLLCIVFLFISLLWSYSFVLFMQITSTIYKPVILSAVIPFRGHLEEEAK